MAKKNRNQSPRRKRMKRQGRLQSAKHWILTYSGKNIIRGYKNWFGVDLICAIRELKMLGVKLDDQYVKQAMKSQEQLIISRHKKAAEKKNEQDVYDYLYDSDEQFYFIAGYTDGGCPYGITWEEAVKDGLFIEKNCVQ